MLYTTYLQGFALGGSLIMAIGAQNAFLLKQGLKRQHLFSCALTCFLCDSLLIILGVQGIGSFVKTHPNFSLALQWGGAFFLMSYGMRCFYNVFHPHILIADLKSPAYTSKFTTLLALLGFTFLNPHTYVDTFLILGGVGADYPLNEHTTFIFGALTASFIWFFSLVYGASKLNPLFKNPKAWQILDSIIGSVMIAIAWALLKNS